MRPKRETTFQTQEFALLSGQFGAMLDCGLEAFLALFPVLSCKARWPAGPAFLCTGFLLQILEVICTQDVKRLSNTSRAENMLNSSSVSN